MILFSSKQFLVRQKGAVLVMVLWLITLGLILVTAIATNVRLSATTVSNHQEALQRWSGLLETINKAHLEILIQKMDKIKVKEATAYKGKSNDNPFDGRALKLHYQTPEGMTVRIFDLSGKINISKLSESKLKQLLEHSLGEHNKTIPELVDAWFDWTDKDDLKRLNGAEKQYYEKQKMGYVPRNNRFASVDEIRLIKGFDQVFSDVNLEEVFTLYGNLSGVVNPNIASKQVLLMIPGINEKIADDIIKARQTQEFKNLNELNIHLPPSILAKAKSWFTLRNSNFYGIVVYPSEYEDPEKQEQSISVYLEEVQAASAVKKPVVLRANPYAKIHLDTTADN